MSGNFLSKRNTIVSFLVVQLIPLILLPPSSFNVKGQEWWLPLVLTIASLIAVIQLIRSQGTINGAWYLLNFAHGFNIISRLMMLFPHSTMYVNGEQTVDALYVIIAVLTMSMSAFMLWYTERPDVRLGLIKKKAAA